MKLKVMSTLILLIITAIIPNNITYTLLFMYMIYVGIQAVKTHLYATKGLEPDLYFLPNALMYIAGLVLVSIQIYGIQWSH